MDDRIKIWDLPRGAKTEQWISEREGEKEISKDFVVLKFEGMDGMYGKRRTPNGDIVNFNGEFIKKGDLYEIVEE